MLYAGATSLSKQHRPKLSNKVSFAANMEARTCFWPLTLVRDGDKPIHVLLLFWLWAVLPWIRGLVHARPCTSGPWPLPCWSTCNGCLDQIWCPKCVFFCVFSWGLFWWASRARGKEPVLGCSMTHAQTFPTTYSCVRGKHLACTGTLLLLAAGSSIYRYTVHKPRCFFSCMFFN